MKRSLKLAPKILKATKSQRLVLINVIQMTVILVIRLKGFFRLQIMTDIHSECTAMFSTILTKMKLNEAGFGNFSFFSKLEVAEP